MHKSLVSSFKRRRFVLMVVAICTFVVSPSRAQMKIEASSGQFSYDCNLGQAAGPGLRKVYIRLTFNIDAMAVRYRLALGPGVTMSYVSESTPYTSVGYALSGISVCFGSCLPGSQLIQTVTFMSSGTDAPCSEVLIVPHPDAQTVEAQRCNGATFAAYVQDLTIMPPGALPCACSPTHLFPGTPMPFDCTPPVAVENTTWGHIKALYVN